MSDDRRDYPVLQDRAERTQEAPSEKAHEGVASRAKNQTVMLTPEMAGQVRAMLSEQGSESKDPLSQLLSSSGWSKPPSTAEPSRQAPQLPEQHQQPSSEQFRQPSQFGTFSSRPQPAPVQQGPYHAPTPMGAGAVSRNGQGGISNVSGTLRLIAGKELGKVVGFLVSYDESSEGEVVELRSGRWLVSPSVADQGNYILINDRSISPLHAVMRIKADGTVHVLDQLSESGTWVKKLDSDTETEVVGSMEVLKHGDILRLGERYFLVCLIPSVPGLPPTKAS